MKRLFFVLVMTALLAGCDYTVPLVTTPSLDIDRSAVGLWQRTKADGETERLLVLPLGGKEYLVSYPAGSEKAMFARACLWRGAGGLLVQLDWFGTAQAKLPTDKRTFQYASYAVDGDSISVRMLSNDVVPKSVETAQGLIRAISDNRRNPALFREPMVFRKVKG